MNAVELTDRVVLDAERVEPWLARWRRDYLPGARERGLSLRAVGRSWSGPSAVTVSLTWALPDPYAFYAMRSAAAQDPAVAAFWAWTDSVARERDRRAVELTVSQDSQVSRHASDGRAEK